MITRNALFLQLVLTGIAIATCDRPVSAQTSPGEVLAEQKISDTSGEFMGTLDDDDRFGDGVAALGDLNGDGTLDLVVGAPRDDDTPGTPSNNNRGAVWVLFLDYDGTVKSHQKISDDAGGFGGMTEGSKLSNLTLFGSAVSAIGDVDGDGITDIAVGGPGHAGDRGAVWILFLNNNGTIKGFDRIDSSGLIGLGAGDGLGEAIEPLGDLDGNGVPDLAIGAPRGGNSDRGEFWIVFLDDDCAVGDCTVKSAVRIEESTGGLTGTVDANTRLGSSIANLGDLDGDGVVDLAVGGPGHPSAGFNGAVWIVLLKSDGTVKSNFTIAEGLNGFSGDLDADDWFGYSLASLGDMDGDGNTDLAVGALREDDGGANRGALWILFLNADGTVKSHDKLSSTSGGLTSTLNDDDHFATDVDVVGDLDGDGVVDLVVGAWLDDDGGTPPSAERGAAYVLFLDGPPSQQPFTPLTNAQDGQPGQPGVIDPSGPADDLISAPFVVVPNITGDAIDVNALEAQLSGVVEVSPVGTFTTGEEPIQTAQTDFNEDGNDDVVTANRAGNSFSYLQADPDFGDPPFEPQVETVLTANSAPIAIGTGDFNGDNNADVVVAGDAGITYFDGDGMGGFGSVPTFSSVSLVTGFAIGDVFEAAPEPDLVTASGQVANPTEGGFATVMQNDGSGGFTSMGTFAAGQALASVLLGDVNDDNDLDALVAVHQFDSGPMMEPQGALEVYLGDGSGGFTLHMAFPGPSTEYTTFEPTGVHPTYGTLGDLNGDMLVDAVYTSNDNISHAAGTFADEQPPLEVTVLLNTMGTPGTFTVSTQGTPYVGKGVTPLLQDVAPVDGLGQTDGVLDLILVWSGDADAGSESVTATGAPQTFVAVLVGNGDGTFTDPAPNQFVSGDDPGDGDTGDLSPPALGGVSAPDLVLPNLADNSLSVYLNDGAGTLTLAGTIPDVDDEDGSGMDLCMGGVWEGGPREVQLTDLDADGAADAVVQNLWTDESGFCPVDAVASLSLFLGDGVGGFTRTQYLTRTRGGEAVTVHVDADAHLDLVLTERLGSSGTDELRIHAGLGDGTVNATPTILSVPAGFSLTGGLVVADVDGDLDLDVVTTVVEDMSGEGAVLVYAANGSTLTAQTPQTLALPWAKVRSLEIGDLTADGIPDLVIGEADGRLFVAQGGGTLGVPDGSYSVRTLGAVPGTLGGGAVRLGDVSGDGRLDIVSSNATGGGAGSQAFVRTLRSTGPGVFEVETVAGVSSLGSQGSLRPLLADVNDDGATDVLLVHGTADSFSVLVNQLNGFSDAGGGMAGASGIVPTLEGRGYSTPGGTVQLELRDAPGGGVASLLSSGAAADDLAVWPIAVGPVGMLVNGAPGTAGAGSLTVDATIPLDPTLVGLQVTLRMVIQAPFDPGRKQPVPSGGLGGGSITPGTPGPPLAPGMPGPPGSGSGSALDRSRGSLSFQPVDLYLSNSLLMEIRL